MSGARSATGGSGGASRPTVPNRRAASRNGGRPVSAPQTVAPNAARSSAVPNAGGAVGRFDPPAAAGVARPRGEQRGEAAVDEHRPAVGQADVAGVNLPVDHPRRLRRRHSRGEAAGEVKAGVRGEPAAGGDSVGEGGTVGSLGDGPAAFAVCNRGVRQTDRRVRRGDGGQPGEVFAVRFVLRGGRSLSARPGRRGPPADTVRGAERAANTVGTDPQVIVAAVGEGGELGVGQIAGRVQPVQPEQIAGRDPPGPPAARPARSGRVGRRGAATGGSGGRRGAGGGAGTPRVLAPRRRRRKGGTAAVPRGFGLTKPGVRS